MKKIKVRSFIKIATCFLFLTSIQSLAQSSDLLLKSDEIKGKAGHEEKTLGVKVYKVEDHEHGVKISMSIPTEITDGSNGQLEEIVVYGKPTVHTEPRPEIPQIQEFEIVNDLKHGRSGVVIYLDKNEDFTLHFNYTDDSKDPLAIPPQ